MSRRDQLWLIAITIGSLGVALFGHFQWGSDWFEVTAFVSSVVSVYLLTRENIWGWPIGIVSSAIFVWVFFVSRLFADMWLYVFYVVMLFHGWWSWVTPYAQAEPLQISRLKKGQWAWVLAATVVGTAIHYPLVWLAKGAAPFWDSLLAAVSYVAQFMQNRKVIDNWVLWILVNLAYMPLYFSRKLYLTAILSLILLWLAGVGLAAWDKTTKQKPLATGSPAD